MKKFRRAVCITIWALLLGSPATAHTFIPLNAPFPNVQTTVARGINNRGEVVGVYVLLNGTQHGFFYSRGQFTTIDVPDSVDTQALGISDQGTIVGLFQDARGTHGFRYDGLFATIDVPFANATSTAAYGINRRGQIVGSYSDGKTSHGFLYERGHFSTIDVPNSQFSTPFGINNKGQIVGSFNDGTQNRGFFYEDGVFTTISVPFAMAFDDGALGINNAGDIVGYYQNRTPQATPALHGYIDYQGIFDAIDVPGGINAMAWDINDRGEYVGDYVSPTTGRTGFIATTRRQSPPLQRDLDEDR